jgi:hypothetical protein
MVVKKSFISWDEFNDNVEKLVSKIKDVDYIVGIPRGGLILAVTLSHKLDIKHMTVDHLEKLEDLNFLNYDRKKILIVDDISDSGQTLKYYKKAGYTTATLDVRSTTITKPDYYVNWIDNADWIVYPWERKDSNTIQDYLEN